MTLFCWTAYITECSSPKFHQVFIYVPLKHQASTSYVWVTCPTGQVNAKIHLSVTKDWLPRYIVWHIQLRNCHLPHRADTSELWPVDKYMFQSFACLGQPLMWKPEHSYSNLLLATWDNLPLPSLPGCSFRAVTVTELVQWSVLNDGYCAIIRDLCLYPQGAHHSSYKPHSM